MLYYIRETVERTVYDELIELGFKPMSTMSEYMLNDYLLVDIEDKSFKSCKTGKENYSLINMTWLKNNLNVDVNGTIAILESIKRNLDSKKYDYYEMSYQRAGRYGIGNNDRKVVCVDITGNLIEIWDAKLRNADEFLIGSDELKTIKITRLVGVKTIRDVILGD